jgi:hypothetical protein
MLRSVISYIALLIPSQVPSPLVHDPEIPTAVIITLCGLYDMQSKTEETETVDILYRNEGFRHHLATIPHRVLDSNFCL